MQPCTDFVMQPFRHTLPYKVHYTYGGQHTTPNL